MNDLDSLLFNIEFNKCLPIAGDLLIAEPFLREEYFCRGNSRFRKNNITKSIRAAVAELSGFS